MGPLAATFTDPLTSSPRPWVEIVSSPRDSISVQMLRAPSSVTSRSSKPQALRRQNRVLIWIDGHIPSRVIEFFLTDWMHGHRIG